MTNLAGEFLVNNEYHVRKIECCYNCIHSIMFVECKGMYCKRPKSVRPEVSPLGVCQEYKGEIE